MVSLRPLAFFAVLLLLFLPTKAHIERPWQSFFQDVMASEGDAEGLDEEAYETLCDLETHPIDINSATPDDLSRLPFLTERQIDDICSYVKSHGTVRSLGELHAIGSLDNDRIQLLSCFITANQSASRRLSLGKLLSQGDHEVLATASIPLYKRRGDINGYLGYNVRHALRYDFSAADRLRFGLTGSQDSGEPFMSSGNSMGYDHYSFFLQMRDLGCVSNLVAGHYRVQFGMGLVANTGLSLGKTFAMSTLGRQTNAVSPSASRSVAGYMQGVAATVRLADRAEVTAFLSARPHDATLNKADGTVATLTTTGYHRTPTEMERKNNTNMQTAGFNARVGNRHIHVGLTGIYTHFNRPLKPNTAIGYKRYYPSGSNFANVGVSYGFVTRWFAMSGETAVDRQGHVATVNTASLDFGGRIAFMLLHRYYSPKYASLHSSSFSDGGRVANEHGVYLGMAWKPSPRFSLNAYADYTHYPWMRYLTSSPSDAFDVMVSGQMSLKRWTLNARYRLRTRQRDNETKTVAIRQDTHRARLKVAFDSGTWWSTTTQADFALAQRTACNRGVAVSQRFNVAWRWLKASVSGSWFVTDNYESRLYAYEQGPLHSFSFPALYGRGVRYSVLIRTDLSDKLMLLGKIGVTDYFDRSTISSGLQTIDHSSKADVDVQLRWRF